MTTPRQTPLVLDALLLSFLVMLAFDAVAYLRYGDFQWDPWYTRVLDPFRHLFILPPALLGLWLGRRARNPRAAAWLLAIALAFIGSYMYPELAHN